MILSITDISAIPDLTSFYVPLWIHSIFGFLMAFTISFLAIPLIVKADWMNNLYSVPNGRTSHAKPVPVFGGVAVFAAFIISIITFAGPYFETKFIYSMAGLIIIFIVGAKDDLTNSRARMKLMGQILASVYAVVLADIRISDLHGVFGMYTIPYLVSVGLTIFVIVVIINSFNLIDGIDGLASGIGILVACVLGEWFLKIGNHLYTIVCFALAGALIAFFYFNVFSKTYKIFLGDTGSEISGFLLAVIMIRFLQIEPTVQGKAVVESTPAAAISLFILPLFDMLRVFTIRVSHGKSPFKADHQHIHHRLLDLGLSHIQSTVILLTFNVIMMILVYFLRNLGTLYLLGIQLGVCSLLSWVLTHFAKERKEGKDISYNLKVIDEDSQKVV